MFDDLNPQQKEAVTHGSGPLLIFAGAGSGKTRVITYRIANLILEHNVEPERILAVTFTRKAAGEMKDRVRALLTSEEARKKAGGLASRLPYVGTFHSFGAFVLRRDGNKIGLPQGFSIYDPDDALHVVKQVMDELNIDKKQFNPNNIRNSISSAKNEMVLPAEFIKFVQGPFDEVVAQVYPKYEDALRSQSAVDFDDLQILPVRLFKEVPEVLQKYNEQYQYLLVDEYQDTNGIQYSLVRMLSGQKKNVCVVGDDDQGIYSWRGATIKNILSFERDFPGAKVVKLEKNYRSTKNILSAAHSVIRRNNERADKELWTDAEGGPKLTIYEAKDHRDESRFVVDRIRDLRMEGVNLNDMVVLYRTNAQSRAFEEDFLRNAIPYKLVGAVRFYERMEIKDMLAYLRFLANPRDDVALLRIINTPPRKIGKKTVDDLRRIAHGKNGEAVGAGLLLLVLYGVQKNITNWEQFLPGMDVDENLAQRLAKDEDVLKIAKKLDSFIKLIGGLYEASIEFDVRLLLDEVLEQTSYENWIDDGTPQAQSRKENLFELKVVAEKYVPQGPRDSLLSFLADVALVEQDLDTEKKQEEDAVTLMTLHSAKGLEFDTVFMVGMEEGLFPHSMSFGSPAELEEERRLCYVGITRAKKRLFLTLADNRQIYGSVGDRIPSRFISEIPMELVNFSSWGNFRD